MLSRSVRLAKDLQTVVHSEWSQRVHLPRQMSPELDEHYWMWFVLRLNATVLWLKWGVKCCLHTLLRIWSQPSQSWNFFSPLFISWIWLIHDVTRQVVHHQLKWPWWKNGGVNTFSLIFAIPRWSCFFWFQLCETRPASHSFYADLALNASVLFQLILGESPCMRSVLWVFQ